MNEKLGPLQDIDFKLRDYRLFNTRPVPLGYAVAFSYRDLKAFLAYSDSRSIRKHGIAAAYRFDDVDREDSYGVIGIYTDFLPDSFKIEQGANIFDHDTESFELNLCCVTGQSSAMKPSQRLVLLEGKIPPEIEDSALDIDLTIHYGNATWDGKYFEYGASCSVLPLISPRRVSKQENPLLRLSKVTGPRS